MASRQHHKGRKRPRGWHRGRHAGRLQARALEPLDHAEERARTAEDELRSVAARYQEEIDIWAGLDRAAPFVPRIEAAL